MHRRNFILSALALLIPAKYLPRQRPSLAFDGMSLSKLEPGTSSIWMVCWGEDTVHQVYLADPKRRAVIDALSELNPVFEEMPYE